MVVAHKDEGFMPNIKRKNMNEGTTSDFETCKQCEYKNSI